MSWPLIRLQKEHNIKTDKNTYHNYLNIYEKLFSKFKYEDINFCEIGVLAGESMKLWREYFSDAKIYGLDTFTRVSLTDVKNNIGDCDVELRVCDSFEDDEVIKKKARGKTDGTSYGLRKKFFEELGDEKFHIIIDDGHHAPASQWKTFNNFKHYLHPDGVYIIEDIKGEKSGKEINENVDEDIIIKRMSDHHDDVLGIYSKDENFYGKI